MAEVRLRSGFQWKAERYSIKGLLHLLTNLLLSKLSNLLTGIVIG